MTATSTSPFSDRLARIGQELEAANEMLSTITELNSVLEKHRGVLTEAPDFAASVAEELRNIANGIYISSSPPKIILRNTAYKRIVKFFEANGNQPASIPEIAVVAECKPPTVRQLIYGRRRSAFERVVDSGKVKYRLCQFAE